MQATGCAWLWGTWPVVSERCLPGVGLAGVLASWAGLVAVVKMIFSSQVTYKSPNGRLLVFSAESWSSGKAGFFRTGFGLGKEVNGMIWLIIVKNWA